MIEELRTKVARLYEAARSAPMNPARMNHDGHRWVEQQSDAWARRSREWINARLELDASERKLRGDTP